MTMKNGRRRNRRMQGRRIQGRPLSKGNPGQLPPVNRSHRRLHRSRSLRPRQRPKKSLTLRRKRRRKKRKKIAMTKQTETMEATKTTSSYTCTLYNDGLIAFRCFVAPDIAEYYGEMLYHNADWSDCERAASVSTLHRALIQTFTYTSP